MKLKMVSLLLLGLGWSPSIVWFLSFLYSPNKYFVDWNTDLKLMELITIIILPVCGGFLAGWCWGWRGLLMPLIYVGSALIATPIYLEFLSFIFKRFPIPLDRLPEGPTGLILLYAAGPGTIVAFIGSCVGVVVWLTKQRRIKHLNYEPKR